MADGTSPSGTAGAGGELRVGGFFDALRTRRELQEQASRPLHRGDPVLTVRLKEVEAYVEVFLKNLAPRRPVFRLLEHPADPQTPTKVELVFEDAIQFYEALSMSFSKGGIFIKTESLLPIDSLLTLRVRLKAEAVEFTVSGKVIWVNPRESQGRPVGLGVKFYKLSSIQRQVLDDFMAGELPAQSLVHLSE